MTKREGAIISAYTGILVGGFDALHKYVEELFNGPVFTHQFPALESEIKKRSEADFVALCEGQED